MTINAIIANQKKQITNFFVDLYKHASADSYAQFCQKAGVSKQTFSNIISGKCPRLEILAKLSGADMFSIFLTQQQDGILFSAAFDFADPLGGMIEQGYRDYMSSHSFVVSATKGPQLRPNDQISLSVETELCDRQLNRLFVKRSVKQPTLGTILSLCHVFGIQITIAPPTSMADFVTSLKFNVLPSSQASPTLAHRAADEGEEL